MLAACLACSIALSVYFGLLAFIYSAILIADLWLIIRKAEVDDYIIAATIIYLDIIRLLVVILAGADKSK